MTLQRLLHVSLCCAAAMATPAIGQTTSPVAGHVLYGINRDHGRLVRLDFSEGMTNVGTVTMNNTALAGINGAAYVPGFQNIFAFWYDGPRTDCQLIFVDVETAKATKVFSIEGGPVTGAAAAPSPTTGLWSVYATQGQEVPPPFTVRGLVNLNPNNSADSEFTLIRPNGTRLTRDQLHDRTTMDANGNAYVGDAVTIRFKPKGNGNQNGLMIDGKGYDLRNSNTYTLNGTMQVRVFNDKPRNGRAMGHWWLEITGGTALWADAAVQTPRRLVHVDHHTGVVTELMRTTRDYQGLATQDGLTFYATHGDDLYMLTPSSETEVEVGGTSRPNAYGLEFVNGNLTLFEAINDRLLLVNPLTGALGNFSVSTSAGDLGTIVYAPKKMDPTVLADSYD